jgi:murein L,D-transpeptidase YcbB/YkuD
MLRAPRFLLAGATAVTFASLPAIPAFASAAPTPAPMLYDRAVDPWPAAIEAALAESQKRPSIDKRDRAGVLAYYQATGHAPVWTADGVLSPRAAALIARLKQAEIDGLDPGVFQTPDVALGKARPASMPDLARADVMLSHAILAYARQARTGRLDPATISPNITYKPQAPDPIEVLANVASAEDPAAALEAYNPQHSDFLALRSALAAARAQAKGVPKVPVIATGPMMSLGATDPRVETLRVRLGVTEPTETPRKFDQALQAAVKAFQKEHGLNPDGIVGQGTINALNAAADDHISLILANMERWRWMPRELGKFYVRVNVPNFNLEVYRDAKVVWTTRIVVGKRDQQTPIFSDEMEHVIVNPVWNVPESIVVNEMLPEIFANPYRALAGYQVFYNWRGFYEQINPWRLDWRRVDIGRVQIKQPPGPGNALGTIKFMFPNQHAVYLHDTPQKSLFAYDFRAYSHGCMRVQDPWMFAEVLMTQQPGLTTAALKKLVGGPERQVMLPNRVPVHITYFTAWVDASGKLQVRNDIYGHDAAVERALGLQSV